MLRHLILLTLIIWIAGCGKPEVKSYKDLIADNALIVFKIKSEAELLKLLSAQLGTYFTAGKMAFPYLDSQKEAVIAITDINSFTYYAAIPLTEGNNEKVLESLPEWQRSKSEVRSNYLFIPLSGDLPSSYGKYKYELGKSPLEMSVDSEALIVNGESEIKRFIKRGQLFNYLNLMPQIREPLKELLLDSGIELLKQSRNISFSMKRTKVVENELVITFKDGSELAGVTGLSSQKLPLNSLDKGVKISASATLDKLPVFTDITSFFIRMWLAESDKKELILPLHTLINEMKDAEFSLITGMTSGNLEGMDFAFKSADIPKLLNSYILSLTGASPVVKGNCLSSSNISVQPSKRNGILAVDIDFESEAELQKKIIATYSNCWNMMMSVASLRISNSFIRNMVQSLKPPPFELNKILTTVTAGEKKLTFKVEF